MSEGLFELIAAACYLFSLSFSAYLFFFLLSRRKTQSGEKSFTWFTGASFLWFFANTVEFFFRKFLGEYPNLLKFPYAVGAVALTLAPLFLLQIGVSRFLNVYPPKKKRKRFTLKVLRYLFYLPIFLGGYIAYEVVSVGLNDIWMTLEADRLVKWGLFGLVGTAYMFLEVKTRTQSEYHKKAFFASAFLLLIVAVVVTYTYIADAYQSESIGPRVELLSRLAPLYVLAVLAVLLLSYQHVAAFVRGIIASVITGVIIYQLYFNFIARHIDALGLKDSTIVYFSAALALTAFAYFLVIVINKFLKNAYAVLFQTSREALEKIAEYIVGASLFDRADTLNSVARQFRDIYELEFASIAVFDRDVAIYSSKDVSDLEKLYFDHVREYLLVTRIRPVCVTDSGIVTGKLFECMRFLKSWWIFPICFEGVERDLVGILSFGPRTGEADITITAEDIELISEVADELYMYVSSANEAILRIEEKAAVFEARTDELVGRLQSRLEGFEQSLASFEERLATLADTPGYDTVKDAADDLRKRIAEMKKTKATLLEPRDDND